MRLSLLSSSGTIWECSKGYDQESYAAAADDDEDVEALAADLDELEAVMEDVDLEELTQEEADTFAAEAQKLGMKASAHSHKPNYKQARAELAKGKVNRGWASADGDGRLRVDDKDYRIKLEQLKAKTKCHSCGRVGHWTGDADCPKKSSKGKGGKGKGKSKGGKLARAGGFMKRAGLAVLMFSRLMLGCEETPRGGHIIKLCAPKTTLYNNATTYVDTFAVAGGAAPVGYAVLDTACLRGCAGGAALDDYVDKTGVRHKMRESSMHFRGINDKAPIRAEGEQEIPVGIAGRGCMLRFQRLKGSKAPLLISIGQLRTLKATIDLACGSVTFGTLNVTVPIVYSERGHAMIRIDQWPTTDECDDNNNDLPTTTTQ